MHSFVSNKEILHKINITPGFEPQEFPSENPTWWLVFGAVAAARRPIPNLAMPELIGEPMFTLSQVVVDGDTVAVEGILVGIRTDGAAYRAQYCEIYHFVDGAIRETAAFAVETDPSIPS